MIAQSAPTALLDPKGRQRAPTGSTKTPLGQTRARLARKDTIVSVARAYLLIALSSISAQRARLQTSTFVQTAHTATLVVYLQRATALLALLENIALGERYRE